MYLVNAFDNLFAGRRDAWGSVEGRCIKLPLEQRDFEWHLYEEGSVGVYPIVDNKVKWGCVDIDYGFDLLVLAENLKKVLARFDIPCFIEKTKGKGYHCWIFAEDWVPAKTMRHALLAGCDIAGVPPDEINPKQETLQPEQFGNYVNLCYAKKWADEGKRIVIGAGGPEDFVRTALASRVSLETLEKLAMIYQPPKRDYLAGERRVGVMDLPISDRELYRKLGPLAKTIFKDGPLPDKVTGRIDRSTGIARLAHLCQEDGLTADEAFRVIELADLSWGKFHERADCEKQLSKLIDNAYG